MGDYWFARQARADGRGGYPLNWKGRAVIAGFVAAMVGGGDQERSEAEAVQSISRCVRAADISPKSLRRV